MGTLSCSRCGATAEGKTQAEADALIDHAIGKMRGRPCSGKQSDMKWSGGSVTKKVSAYVSEKPKKSPKKTKKKSKWR